MEKTSPEVLIYVQNVKIYFEKNEDVRSYFSISKNGDVFFNHVMEIAKKNYVDHSDPTLTTKQFEEIKNELLNNVVNDNIISGPFIFYDSCGLVGLN